jgi:hypothetical protein
MNRAGRRKPSATVAALGGVMVADVIYLDTSLAPCPLVRYPHDTGRKSLAARLLFRTIAAARDDRTLHVT